jgi:hypothetical protein
MNNVKIQRVMEDKKCVDVTEPINLIEAMWRLKGFQKKHPKNDYIIVTIGVNNG